MTPLSAAAVDGPAAWARGLVGELGASTEAELAAHGLAVTGADPVLPTPLRVGEAAAAAIAAHALAAGELWRLRGGPPQRIEVDVGAATASLLSFLLLRLPGKTLLEAPPVTVALFRARDGWIHLHGGFPHLHEGTLALLGCADDAAAVARAVAGWEAQALEDALAERGLCGARLRSAGEWRAHPQGVGLAEVPLIELIRMGDAPPTPLPGPRAGEPGARPLAGVRVLDLTRVLAGPTCARTLAEHGADVLHVRSPKLPAIEPFVIDTNAGKHSCHLDLGRAEDVARLRGLAGEAHVFAQGYRAGSLARRGFSAEALAALQPGIVVASIDCYGHEGPWATRPGWEQLAQTATGLAHAHAGDEKPSIVPAAVTDYSTGHLAALGVMAALARRSREGGSWHVRVSLARTAMWIDALPRAPAGMAPAGLDPAALVPWGVEMETAWGRLWRLGPIARMSETPPRWELPPAPLGSHPPRWEGAPPRPQRDP
jgi:crotonobetainyl-CoA:carnitine CoA-transferase CaiB-like acyl-CoA transferase